MMSTGQGQFDPLHGATFAAKTAAIMRHFCCCILATLTWISATGCHQIYLPRFDPTGANVFLPFPNTTQLSLSSSPAFQQPPPPPACIDGSDGGVCNLFKHKLVGHAHDMFKHKSPGACGEIQLTPMRVVALLEAKSFCWLESAAKMVT